MLNANAKKWVKALRSRKFEQCRKELKNEDNQYCCLGIACELYRRETGSKRSVKDLSFKKGNGYLGNAVKNWLGLVSGKGSYGMSDSLAQDNDTGQTFDNIARIIESKPNGLFLE